MLVSEQLLETNTELTCVDVLPKKVSEKSEKEVTDANPLAWTK